jgi:ferredoxin-NADP reductase
MNAMTTTQQAPASAATVLREFEADLVVTAVSDAAEGVKTITLGSPDGAALPPWSPGAHIDIVLRGDLTRQYSLCGDASDDATWRIGVLAAPDSRGGSVRVHELKTGDTVRVRGPRNHFPLVGAASYQFIAGGIGITPILAMIAEAEAAGASWSLLYGGRQRASMAFLDELEKYGQDRVTITPQDEQGHLNLAECLGTPRPGTLVYCCGPEGLLAAVEEACAAWPAGSLHIERFVPKAAPADDSSTGSFELVLQRSGLTLPVPPDKSVFDVVTDAGVSVLGSCFEGVCGTCEQAVIDGDVDHRDSILSDEEREANEYMMICVSRCRSARLTLDL